MALTLHPTLAAAQDSLSRKPIVEILSSQTVPDIPFDGQFLQSTLTAEQRPNAITHSSGRLCLVYTFGSAFKYVYTDTGRTEFHFVDIPLPAGQTGVEATLCELASGNIGILYYSTDALNQILRRMVIAPTGEIISAAADIQSYGATHHVLSAPFEVRLADGSYLLVYAHKDIDAGNTYSVSKRTSADFLTWSAEGNCAVGGLTATKRIDNPSLLQISTGQIWLWFDYLEAVSGANELINVYFSTSADNGATWAAATKFTNYTTYDTVGRHPLAFQKIATQMHLLFYEQKGALHMDKSQAGYCSARPLMSGNITFDAVHRKLYVVSSYVSAGTKKLHCVFRVDVDTWTIDACWNSSTVPAFHTIFTDESVNIWWTHHHGENHLIPIGSNGSAGQIHVALLDGEADTITHFHFHAWPEKVIAQNVVWSDVGGTGGAYLSHTWVDFASNRLYCVLYRAYSANRTFHLGYFDLAEGGGTHTFVDVIRETNQVSETEMYGLDDEGAVQILPGSDLIIVSYGHNSPGTTWDGRMRIYTLSTPALYKDYRWSTHPNFPYHGIQKFAYAGGKIYGGFKYDTVYDESEKRGLCVIDLASDNITFQRPTFATIDEYGLYSMLPTPDNKLIILSRSHGVAIYGIAGATWTLYDNGNLAGMNPSPEGFRYLFRDVAYDETNGLIFTGSADVNSSNTLIAFSIYGFLRQSFYQVGEYTDHWTWGAKASLVQGLIDYEAVVALHPDDRTMYAFWIGQARSELSLKWDKEGSSLNLTPYLVSGKEIIFSRTIDGTPASLSFFVSHGYLFDPHNPGSLYSIYLKKARKLTLRMGEKVSGTDYWQNMGTFFVKAVSLSYEREQYPEMQVQAEDIRFFWEDATVIATDSYETTPKEIMEDILTTHAGILLAGMEIPAFDGSSTLYHQWLEVQLKEIVDQIAGRFGYFMRSTVDGKVSCRKISDSNPADHVYSGKTWMVNFTPDDSFSTAINQVIVVGESRDFIDVTFTEEPIDQLNGTVGWWGGKREVEFWYSSDHSRRCRNPRLEVILSVGSFNFRLGGGGESITSVRLDDLGCTITIDIPDLVAVLIATITAIVSLGVAAVYCDGVAGMRGYCGLIIMSLTTLLGILINTVSSMANYHYQVHAQPFGKVRQTIQGLYNDEALQAQIGFVATKKIDDPLCYTVDQCNAVARYEGMIARLDRNALKLTKLAHLQDEEGDTIQFGHPHSGAVLKAFIVKLTRRMQIPASPDSDDGHFLDDIEGWKL